MPIAQIDCREARERQESGAKLIDCRSVHEYVSGHPAGALNIPLLHLDPATQGMFPNQDFEAICRKHVKETDDILILCRSGGRSQQACEILAASGFKNLSNVSGGFSGSPTAPGWSQLDLPQEQGNADSGAYENLRN